MGDAMMTATATAGDGRQVILFGITRENVERLIAGQPIYIGADTHAGFPADLVFTIFFGETERVLVDQIKGLIGPDTKIIAEPKDTGTTVS
jgi:hypothetical protein